MKIVKPIVFNNFESTRASIATYYGATGILETAGVDVARFTYNPTTLDFIGLLLEDEATNLITYSSNIAHPDWTATDLSTGIQTPFTTPDGDDVAMYAEMVGFSTLTQPNGITIGQPSALSVYVKQKGGDGRFELHGNSGRATFNVILGTVNSHGLGGTSQIQALPNGWYRCSIVGLSDGEDVGLTAITDFFGDPSNDKYLWGWQYEAGNAATSYIATSGTPQTRAADIYPQDPPRVIESNVDENDAEPWNNLDNYNAGDIRAVFGSYHRLYESIGTNTDKFPPDHPEEWIDQGVTNRWRMFDMSVGSEKQTVSTDSNNTVNVLLDVDQVVTSVTLLNMEANNVRVIMRDELGEVVYDHYEDLLQETPSSDWWSFFFATRSNIKTLVLTDLPSIRPSTIEMFLDGGAFPAKIGKMIVGEGIEIGCSRYGTSVGIVDFSRKERDAFGNNFILERRYIDRADFDVQIPTSSIDSVKALLAAARATPTLYIGDENYASTVIYGFYRDFSIIIAGPKRSDLTIQVESI